MQPASSVSSVAPDIFRWAAFSPAHKVELTSHAARLEDVLWVFDPIPLTTDARSQLPSTSKTVVILTNGNHERDLAAWKGPGVEVRATSAAVAGFAATLGITPVNAGPLGPWWVVDLDGGGPGELAFRCDARSLVVVGDAVVNLPGRGLELLPEKYCSDLPRLKANLRALTARPFDLMLPAHGDPVRPEASARLTALL